MHIGQQEEIGIEVVVQRDAGVCLGVLAGEVAHFGLTALGDLEFERTLLPKAETVFHRRGWNLRLQDGENLVGGHRRV